MHDKIVIKTLHGSAASAATQTVWGGVVIYFFLQISDSVHLQKNCESGLMSKLRAKNSWPFLRLSAVIIIAARSAVIVQ